MKAHEIDIASYQGLRHDSLFGSRYRLLSQLGQGGFAKVFLANDLALEIRVALKVLNPLLAAEPQQMARFKREVIIARKVSHPNVCKIFDFGQIEALTYLSMEYVHGQNLHEILRRRKVLSLPVALEIGRQICMGLAAAHREGVVHRDLKPQNVMLDDRGVVKIMDFGIAHATDLGGVTHTGAIVGSPTYMSPEQCRGEAGEHRSDLYSLGVVLYQMLVGEPPFIGDTPLGTLYLHNQQPPRPPHELVPSIPVEASALILKCLAKEVDERYSSAEELVEEIGRILRAWPGESEPDCLAELVEVPETLTSGDERSFEATSTLADDSRNAIAALKGALPEDSGSDLADFSQSWPEMPMIQGQREVRGDGHREVRDAELSDANWRKDEFLAVLAHQLRSPLAPIVSALEVLRLQGTGNDAQTWALGVLERQTQQMARLVDDLLDVARIVQGRIVLQMAPIELAPVVNQAVEKIRPLIETLNHTLSVELPESALWIESDAVRLEQILVHLLRNAATYTSPGGQVWLKARQEGRTIVIRVIDTGKGLSPETLGRAFDLFFQGERTHAGLGIGLSVVRGLVQMHGGSVQAHSPGVGRGSEFVVQFPALAHADAGTEDRTRDFAPPLRSRLRVLVVDDDPDTAEGMNQVLQMWGYEASICRDGRGAVQSALEFRADVVLLDIGLPGMDGYAVAAALRQQQRLSQILLVALTGYGDQHDRGRAHESGFDLRLTKPVDLGELHRLLGAREALNLSRLREPLRLRP